MSQTHELAEDVAKINIEVAKAKEEHAAAARQHGSALAGWVPIDLPAHRRTGA